MRKSPFVELTSLVIKRPRSGPPLVIDASHCGRVVALDLHNLAYQFWTPVSAMSGELHAAREH